MITHPLTLQLIDPRIWTDMQAVFVYDPVDPFAVRIGFATGVTWLVSRELLTAGINRPTGEGDVRLWPASATADVLLMHLHAPSGDAWLQLSRTALRAFLAATERLVPIGMDTEVVSELMDDWLDELLDRDRPNPPTGDWGRS